MKIRAVVIDGVGHYPQAEAPDQMSVMILEFCKASSSGANGPRSNEMLTVSARIVDAECLDALTFARLASELSIKPPLLCNQFSGVDGLVDALRLSLPERLRRQRHDTHEPSAGAGRVASAISEGRMVLEAT